MKREIVMWVIIAALVVGALIASAPKVEPMAIDFTGAQNQCVDFGDVVTDLTTKSLSHWIHIDAVDGTNVGNVFDKRTTAGWYSLISTTSSAGYFNNFPAGSGYWRTPDNSTIAGNTYHIVITYDNTSDANDPVIYINGVAQILTKVQTPSGAVSSDAGVPLCLGGNNSTYSANGQVSDARIYNRILTAAEVLQIYNARGRDNIRNGLVFCPFLKGAKGLQAFGGTTLDTVNTINDPCSGAIGVPAGNPVGVGETYLH